MKRRQYQIRLTIGCSGFKWWAFLDTNKGENMVDRTHLIILTIPVKCEDEDEVDTIVQDLVESLTIEGTVSIRETP